MVGSGPSKRLAGRPRAFDPTEVLDRAVEMFWADGFEGVDVDRIARAVGVTKPSLYRLFGDKAALFLRALQHYGETTGRVPLAAFEAQANIVDAVDALLATAIETGTVEDGPKGCLMACVAMVQAERRPEVRAAIMHGLAALTDALRVRFQHEIGVGNLSSTPPALARSRLTVDLLQGLLLRARAGVPRGDLLEDARNHRGFILK